MYLNLAVPDCLKKAVLTQEELETYVLVKFKFGNYKWKTVETA